MINYKSWYAWRLLLILSLMFFLLPACGSDQDEVSETNEQPSVVEHTPELPVSFDGEVVIYVVGPLSGSDAEKGQAQAAGARLAAEELNRAGGLLGQEIVIKMLKLIKPSNMKRLFFRFPNIFLVEKNPMIKKRHGIIITGPMFIRYSMIL